MPLEVYDKNGSCLGIIHDRYLDKDNIYMVAITDLTPSEINFNEDKMKKYLANVVKVKNIFGKVDEDRLKEAVENLRMLEEYEKFQQLSQDDFMMYLFLKNYSGKSIEEYLEIQGFSEEMINGYILFDINRAEVNNGKLCIDNDMDYVLYEVMVDTLIPKISSTYLMDQKEDEWVYDIKPIFGKITGYPIFETDIMGFGEGLILGGDLSDLGGRNHSHETILRIKSGNFEDIVTLPIIVFAKKEMPIQIYVAEKKIKMVFCDEAIYRF